MLSASRAVSCCLNINLLLLSAQSHPNNHQTHNQSEFKPLRCCLVVFAKCLQRIIINNRQMFYVKHFYKYQNVFHKKMVVLTANSIILHWFWLKSQQFGLKQAIRLALILCKP